MLDTNMTNSQLFDAVTMNAQDAAFVADWFLGSLRECGIIGADNEFLIEGRDYTEEENDKIKRVFKANNAILRNMLLQKYRTQKSAAGIQKRSRKSR